MLDKEILNNLHKNMQTIIDCIANKEFKTANSKLEKIDNEVTSFLDENTNDEMIIELSKFQILVEHLQNKLNKAE